MSIIFRHPKSSDLAEYTNMLQVTYSDRYVDETIGLPPKLFSIEVFNSVDTQKYLKSKLERTEAQNTWLAFDGDKLVGSITLIDKDENCELTAFYVLHSYQGMGIGRSLFDLAFSKSRDKDITLEIYAHNKKSIELYKNWGFEVDTARGKLKRHWPEWPEGIEAESIYMRLRRPKLPG